MMLCKWRLLKCQKKFFLKAILPELLGDYFREDSSTLVSNNDDNEHHWRYCRMRLSEDNLIGCDSSNCKVKWVHLAIFRMGLFGIAQGWGAKNPSSLRSFTHILQ